MIPKINKVDATDVYNIENTYVAKARLKKMPINKSNLSNLFIKVLGLDFVIIQAKIITTKLSDIDLKNNIWFARDVERIASFLQTDPILIILKDSSIKGTNITPMPIDTKHIPNDHLQYAITWFSLAIIWALMSCMFVWNTRQKRL